MSKEILSLQNITKAYPGVTALDDVSVSFRKGEVHALLGENGAGKSTLIKIISGAEKPDSGTISIRGAEYSELSPHFARELGIEVIYQEFNLVDTLSAAENIFLGERRGRLVNQREMEQAASLTFDQFGVVIDPSALVRNLPSSLQQIVEIAKAITKNAGILIMDEPTAPLTMSEVDTLFQIIRTAKSQGVTIIYISHRLEEIFQISDRVTVMRDGKCIESLLTAETNRDQLISLMVGRTLNEVFPERPQCSDEVVLELKNVTGNGDTDISLQLHRGEILGLAGLVGAGRSELAKMLYGAVPLDSGSILINGQETRIHSPADALAHGVGLIPENRKEEGCLLNMSVSWNIVINVLKKISRWLVVDRKEEAGISTTYSERLNIKTPSLLQRLRNLSGGNQQKVVIAKTLAANTQILLFDEPTRGIDVGARQEIYQLMSKLVGEGHSILMISSDMEELLGMSDRIIVLSEGRVSGELEKNEFSQERVLELASSSEARQEVAL